MHAAAEHPVGGTTFSLGFDNFYQFFGFAPVADATGSPLLFFLGIPESEVFAGVNERTMWLMGLAIFAVVIAVLLSAAIAYWTQLRPLLRLVQKSERIGNGEFSDTAPIERWQAREFRSLAASLNRTARKLMAAQLTEKQNLETERRFRLVADNTADMITVVDQAGTRTFVSGACRAILGFGPDELLGKEPLSLVIEADRECVKELFRRTKAHVDGGSEQYRVVRKDGSLIWVEVRGRQIAGQGDLVFTMRDISERKAVEAELEAANHQLTILATTDELTSVKNRRELNRRLELETTRLKKQLRPLSVMLIDVDHFKAFNDIYGHIEGDRCLQEIAKAISRAQCQPADLCARYGGEEFAVLLPETDEATALSRAGSLRNVIASLNLMHAGSKEGRVTVSIGIATSYGDLPGSDLLRRADAALYDAKANGRNRVELSVSRQEERWKYRGD